jgi:predicted metalloprotease
VKWRRGQSSAHVDDRRNVRARGPAVAGGGVVAIVIGVVVALLGGGGGGGGGGGSGVDLNDILGQLGVGAGGPVAGGEDVVGGTGGEADDETEDFLRAVMNDLSAFWSEADVPGYRPTTLVLFAGAVDTGCGRGTSSVGPFYCPADEHAYLDVEFFQELHDRFGAPGDFAQAYVIAHEFGHHIQNVLGAEGESVRIELQADCYAGVWAHSVFGAGAAASGDDGVVITDDDIREALDAAAAIGDDRIQEQAGVEVNPESWTHGSSAQRQRWFRAGFTSGRLADCDTFSGDV